MKRLEICLLARGKGRLRLENFALLRLYKTWTDTRKQNTSDKAQTINCLFFGVPPATAHKKKTLKRAVKARTENYAQYKGR